jgi:hypothetical protein
MGAGREPAPIRWQVSVLTGLRAKKPLAEVLRVERTEALPAVVATSDGTVGKTLPSPGVLIRRRTGQVLGVR